MFTHQSAFEHCVRWLKLDFLNGLVREGGSENKKKMTEVNMLINTETPCLLLWPLIKARSLLSKDVGGCLGREQPPGVIGKGEGLRLGGCCCSCLSDKIVRVANISIQPCSVSGRFHVNWSELSVRAPSRAPSQRSAPH